MLATCVLQLYDTPWLKRKWTIDEIYVDEDNPDRLYVLKAFEPQNVTSQDVSDIASSGSDLHIKNKTIFALNVALLEIHFGCPLQDFETNEDGNDQMTEYKIAKRLTREIQEDEWARFAGVVTHCMYPRPEGTDYSLANNKFRKRFMENVVIPLKEDLKDIGGKPKYAS